jgi:8-oxo-dGTP pyrophosphatase MutT (NUDIX family)
MAQTVETKDLYRVVGACIVYRHTRSGEFEYLILRRHPESRVYPGKWTVPAGGMEPEDYESLPKTVDGWEHPLQFATRREVREESGIEVGDFQFLTDFTFERPDGIKVFGIRFSAPYVSGEVQVDPEDATEFRWIGAHEVAKYDLLGDIPAEIQRLNGMLLSRVSR